MVGNRLWLQQWSLIAHTLGGSTRTRDWLPVHRRHRATGGWTTDRVLSRGPKSSDDGRRARPHQKGNGGDHHRQQSPAAASVPGLPEESLGPIGRLGFRS